MVLQSKTVHQPRFSSPIAKRTMESDRIRTGDLRHVKADDLERKVGFSDFFTLLFVAEPGDEATARKASAPS
jgi:hypothetical protein